MLLRVRKGWIDVLVFEERVSAQHAAELAPLTHFALHFCRKVAREPEPVRAVEEGLFITRAGVTGAAVSLDAMVERIVLGPSVSSPLALNSYGRMLELIGKGALKPRVHASTIPLRPASGV